MIGIVNKAFYLPYKVHKKDAKKIVLKQRQFFIVVSLVTDFIIALILVVAFSRGYNNSVPVIFSVINLIIFLFIGFYFLITRPNYVKLENVIKRSKSNDIEVKKFINNSRFVLLEFYSFLAVIIILISFLIIK